MVDDVLRGADLETCGSGDAVDVMDSGDRIDEMTRRATRRRWFGRGGFVAGGTASLLVGALLGGVLEGVPIMFPPLAGATPDTHFSSSSSQGTMQYADYAVRRADDVSRLSSTSKPASYASFLSGGLNPQTGVPSRGSGGFAATSAPAASNTTSPSGTSIPQTGLAGGATASPSPNSTIPIGQAVESLTQTLGAAAQAAAQVATQATSQLPLVGSTVSGAVSSAGALVSSQSSNVAPSSSSSTAPGITTVLPSTTPTVTGATAAGATRVASTSQPTNASISDSGGL